MCSKTNSKIKVALVNTSEYAGGAAIACKRLFESLKKNGTDIKLFVQEKKSSDDDIVNINNELTSKKKNLFYLGLEKLHFYFYEKSKQIRFNFSTALFGKKFYNKKSFVESNVVHLNWFNLGMLSLRGLKKISQKHKIVWTLHDMWAFTGGCHYNAECTNFQQQCGYCPCLKNPGADDISHKQFLKKQEIYNSGQFAFVTCSRWLADVAKSSGLLKNAKVINIPNPIKTDIYKQSDKINCRIKFNIDEDKFVILFGAASLNDKRKGLDYFVEALNVLTEKKIIPKEKILITLFGKSDKDFESLLPYKFVNLGYLSDVDDIISMYSAADVYVTTSLQDNLPNTVMEALSCSLPVVAFGIGGIPEMVEHKSNGFLASFKSSTEIADGLNWIYNSDYKLVSENARRKVVENFDENLIAQKYQKLYLSL